MKKLFLLLLAHLLITGVTQAQLTGIKTIKASGGDYATFTSAINALNASGVGTGGVTFNVDADFVSVENCPIITATGTEANPIVFKKSGTGANPVIQPTSGVGISIRGGDYFIFDGIDVTAGNSGVTSGYYLVNASNSNGAQSNTIKNCTITLFRTNKSTIGIYQRVSPNPSNANGANSFNIYDNVFIQNSYLGIELYGYFAYPDLSCVIRNNTVGANVANDIGNSTTITYGIYSYGSSDIEIYNNNIRNVTVTSTVKVYGLYVNLLKGTNNKIYNNTIHDIKTTHYAYTSVAIGMEVFGYPSSTVEVYNNSIYGLEHGTTIPMSTTVIYGIVLSGGSQGNFYFNSVNINEDEFPSSVCFYSHPTGTGAVELKNNIFANFSLDGSISKYCIYISGGTTSLDYNDYYISTGINNNVGYLNGNYLTLTDWQTGTNFDTHTISADPLFTTPTNLLPLLGSPVIGVGMPISGITTDIVGTMRSLTTPTIGAYEVASVPIVLIWTGAVDSEWFNPGNWGNGIPGAISQVIIPGGLPNYPTLLLPTTIAGITINDGGSFIGSEFLTTASALVKRDVVNSDFHLISSPVTTTTFGDVFPLNQLQVWAREYNETTGDWDNLSIGDFMSVGKGYSVQMNQPQTALFEGVLISEPVTMTLAKQNPGTDPDRVGWNLLGNPFTSAIDWDLTDHAAIDGAVYVWNGTQYISWNGTIGALTDGIIPAENAFFAKTMTDGVNVSIPLSARVHSASDFYKTAVANMLEITAEGNSFTDKTFVHFNQQASADFDSQYDAYKLFGNENAPQLYSMITNSNLSINELPMAGNEIVDLGFTCNTTGIYSITACGTENFASDVPVILQDVKLNTYQNLKLNPVYSFSFEAGENENRFKLWFQQVTGINTPVNNDLKVYSFAKTVVIENLKGLSGEVQIYDITGRILASRQLGTGLSHIQLNVVSGTYMVRLNTNSGTQISKVFIR
jgi:hypothetical protein